MTGCLYAVATPIGNLDDISARALKTLRTVDIIAAEDTRWSLKLLRHFSINTPLLSYHEHSPEQRHERILELLREGKNIALISDAGTPGIADPGQELIRDWVAEGGTATVIPGPSAFVPGLILSGLPLNRFAFEGFLPRAGRLRRQVLKGLASERRTMVFYEAPHRVQDTLADMLASLGDRRASIARELTKVHEEVLRGRISELMALAEGKSLRGELVLVVEGCSDSQVQDAAGNPSIDPEALITELLGQGLSPAQAAKKAAALTKLSRDELYRLAISSRR
jgi:16S rRNA (cytidine1402-2'-O)-methyltransferase